MPESPHLTGFSKALKCSKKKTSKYRSNDLWTQCTCGPRASSPGLSGRGAGKGGRAYNYAPLPERPGELARRLLHMLNVERITKIFACDDDKRFVTNVKCPTGWPHFGSNSPLCGAKIQSNARGMPAGEMGGFGIDCYIISDSRIWILRPFSKI